MKICSSLAENVILSHNDVLCSVWGLHVIPSVLEVQNLVTGLDLGIIGAFVIFE